MIFDQLDQLREYGTLSHGIPAAIDYLLHTDFTQVTEGRYELDGDRLFAIVQRYNTKPVAEARWEAHRRYIDVQHLLEGEEQMGHFLCRPGLAVEQPYDEAKDVVFYKGQGAFFRMLEGDTAIFLPQDVHAPCLAVDDKPIEVRKVVVKCRMD
jgi:YhcH/YjgK/YiaL family protein